MDGRSRSGVLRRWLNKSRLAWCQPQNVTASRAGSHPSTRTSPSSRPSIRSLVHPATVLGNFSCWRRVGATVRTVRTTVRSTVWTTVRTSFGGGAIRYGRWCCPYTRPSTLYSVRRSTHRSICPTTCTEGWRTGCAAAVRGSSQQPWGFLDVQE
jgi:hypothetical protein